MESDYFSFLGSQFYGFTHGHFAAKSASSGCDRAFWSQRITLDSDYFRILERLRTFGEVCVGQSEKKRTVSTAD
jgi:hypothetical protein